MDNSKIKKLGHKVGDKLVHSDNIVFTFLRSIVSSQAASWADIGLSLLLVALGVSPWLATPAGAILGGIVNCCLNYKYTFHAHDVSRRAVAVKYSMVWFGSLTLNTVGTSLLTMLLDKSSLLTTLGFTNLGNYAAARLFVSLMVSWFWNFLLQRNFVYKPSKFDPTAIKIADFFIGKKKNKETIPQDI